MKLNSEFTSPNFATHEIPVEFLVLHYTACDLKRTLEIFQNRERKVCAHFVLDLDGTCYDLGGFWNGPILQGAHAGESYIDIDGQRFETLNKMSIGIEIVNFNGNLFPYTDAQYETLSELILRLLSRFPVLRDSRRIVGHEHIAHFRGKCDPGVKFDWQRTLGSVGLLPQKIHSFHACEPTDLARLERRALERGLHGVNDSYWAALSAELETHLRERARSGERAS
jgi:N-acetyl-anhydromuramyl-L-alanine amidase AmpD